MNLRYARRRPPNVHPVSWHYELARREVYRKWPGLGRGDQHTYRARISVAFHRRLRAAGIVVEGA